ncbi:MAG: hypothetical protein ABI622_02705 [Chloroflexota bacterium]
MSREERRAYERMNKGRDPFAPPVSAQARQRMERQKQKRTARRGTRAGSGQSRFVLWAVGGFVIIGLAAFSLAWPQGMPNALYIGLGAAIAWLALAFIARWAASRSAASDSPPPR